MLTQIDENMGTKHSSASVSRSDVSVTDAAWVVIGTAPLGYLVGVFLTAQVVYPVTLAVWLTTVVFTLLGFAAWSLWLDLRT